MRQIIAPKSLPTVHQLCRCSGLDEGIELLLKSIDSRIHHEGNQVADWLARQALEGHIPFKQGDNPIPSDL